MSDSTDIQATLMYGKNNKIRPYFYAYQRSEEERKSSPHESDFGGESSSVNVTGLLTYFTINRLFFMKINFTKKNFVKMISRNLHFSERW